MIVRTSKGYRSRTRVPTREHVRDYTNLPKGPECPPLTAPWQQLYSQYLIWALSGVGDSRVPPGYIRM